ncbi:hypothetical protein ACFX15_028690 [Malus domestica]
MSFLEQQDEESNVESLEKAGSSELPPKVDKSPGETESLQLTSTYCGDDDASYTEGNDIAAVGDGDEDVEFVAVGAPHPLP